MKEPPSGERRRSILETASRSDQWPCTHPQLLTLSAGDAHTHRFAAATVILDSPPGLILSAPPFFCIVLKNPLWQACYACI